MTDEKVVIEHGTHEGATFVVVKAGHRGTERIVPPAGEQYAFDRTLWARRVEVHVSPAGRSTRVFVDGTEIRTKQEDPE